VSDRSGSNTVLSNNSENVSGKVVNMNEHEGVGREQDIYTKRFSSHEEKVRNETWEVLVPDFFQKYISHDSSVLDLGAGDGLFISKIKAKERIAVDLSSHVNKLKDLGITVIQAPATDFVSRLTKPVDVIFMSNFLEHMPDKRTLLAVLEECANALNPGGRVMILQPNIRYVGVKYWDYIDHHIALTEYSLVEALEVSGFSVRELIPQFLPYTAKSGIGKISSLFSTKSMVSNYLKYPFLWKIFGAQTFVEAIKK
jgi:SAM-dependent methyltransferase